MLKDRRELLEHDLRIAKDQAAKMYLGMVIDGPYANEVYESLRDRIANLEFDLTMVNKLIDEGAE